MLINILQIRLLDWIAQSIIVFPHLTDLVRGGTASSIASMSSVFWVYAVGEKYLGVLPKVLETLPAVVN